MDDSLGRQVKALAVILLLFFQSSLAFAASKYYGRVVTDGALVYQSNNFDSEVLAHLREGQHLRISKKIYGAFYRVLLPSKQVGYVADVDIQPISTSDAEASTRSKAQVKRSSQEEKHQQVFSRQRWRGPSFSQIQFREVTMGRSLSSAKSFYGFKIAGPDLLIEGNMPTEANFYFSSGAPVYYSQATGRSAGGFLFLADCHMQYLFPQGQNTISFFGMGPMFRYSKFDVELPGTSGIGYYSLEDMVLGASFNLGVGQRFSSVSVRLEGQYYWEATQYWGLGASFLIGF